jgi:hypothetical protein
MALCKLSLLRIKEVCFGLLFHCGLRYYMHCIFFPFSSSSFPYCSPIWSSRKIQDCQRELRAIAEGEGSAHTLEGRHMPSVRWVDAWQDNSCDISHWSNCVLIGCISNSVQKSHVRFDVFTTVTMKNAIFWDVTPYGSCKNQHFGGTYCLHHQGDRNWWVRNNVSSN